MYLSASCPCGGEIKFGRQYGTENRQRWPERCLRRRRRCRKRRGRIGRCSRRRRWEIQKESVKGPSYPFSALRNVGDPTLCRRIPRPMRSLLFISLFLSLRSAPATARAFKTRTIDVYRPRKYTAVNEARVASVMQEKCHDLQWDRLSVLAPDVTDQHTLAQLGRMAANAYALPGAPNWWDLDPVWSSVRAFQLINQSYNLQLTTRFTVVPNRVGEPDRRVPRPCFCEPGQLHRCALDQGHHAQRTHIKGRQTERQPLVLMLLCPSRLYLGVPDCMRLLRWALAMR